MVVLPAPEGPVRTVTARAGISIDTDFRTLARSKLKLTDSNAMSRSSVATSIPESCSSSSRARAIIFMQDR